MSKLGARPGQRHVVCLLGRLGNQFFQYSFARWLEHETGLDVRFDLAMTRPLGIAGPAEFVDEVNRRDSWVEPISRAEGPSRAVW